MMQLDRQTVGRWIKRRKPVSDLFVNQGFPIVVITSIHMIMAVILEKENNLVYAVLVHFFFNLPYTFINIDITFYVILMVLFPIEAGILLFLRKRAKQDFCKASAIHSGFAALSLQTDRRTTMEVSISPGVVKSEASNSSSSSDKHSASLQAVVDNKYRFEQLFITNLLY